MSDADERAMIERLARFMGWAPGMYFGRTTWDAEGKGSGGYPPLGAWQDEWNPLTDANADVQVLQRAREVWDVSNVSRFSDELDRILSAHWDGEVDAPGWAAITEPMLYHTGDYARAVVAVLTTTERGSNE